MQWATLPRELWPLEYADKRGNEGEKIKWMYNKEFISLEEKQGFVQPCISRIHGRDLFLENTWTMKGLFGEIKILRLTVLLTLNLTIFPVFIVENSFVGKLENVRAELVHP